MEQRTKSIEEIREELEVDVDNGLTTEQAEEHREKYGNNEFDEEEKSSLLSKIADQFKEVMNIILLFAGFLSLYIAISDPTHGYAETIVIFLIIIINIALTIYQENKAENALDALKDISSPQARVIRDGQEQKIESAEIVQGDILMLDAGEAVPADARLIEANNLQAEESSLTGESVPADKDPDAGVEENASIGDVLHTVFSGTSITNGNAKAVVVGVGMDSEMGSIAGLLTGNDGAKTPLQKRIDRLAKILAVLAIISGAIIFAINFITSDISFLDNLMLAVSLGIAAVPETLPVIVTLSLAYGVQNMAEKHAIIRNIPAVETLGSASIIASDKTGTLTQNKMTVQKLWSDTHDVTDAEDEFNEDEEWTLKMLSLASNAQPREEDGELKVSGNPTEAAIIYLLEQKGWSLKEVKEDYPRVHEFPFDSDRKQMTTIHEYGDEYLVISKGAVERISDNLKPKAIEGEHNPQEIHDNFAEEALRVLAVSYKMIDEIPENVDEKRDEMESEMIFSGMVGMIDPPREESIQSVKEAISAGIRPIMITGDHAVTATAIAKQIGIADEDTKTLTGTELQEMSDEELNNYIEDYAVYARVSPEDKIRIVEAWQNKDEVVAMTGDGVNDAPSLQAADVGTAMGENGTEVAKNASDMILTDDNFATIVQAVEEGRRVYGNIKKTVYFLLSANIAEIFIMLITAIIGWGTPLLPIHLLFINVIADGIPGFGLSAERAEEDIMDQDPVPRNESIFVGGGYRRIGTAAPVFIIITLIAFYLGGNVQFGSIAPSLEVAQTMAFLTLSWSSVLHILVVRRHASIFKAGITENKTIFWTTLLAVVLTAALVAIPPLASIFSLVEISMTHWIIAAVLSLMIIVVVEIEKYLTRKMKA